MSIFALMVKEIPHRIAWKYFLNCLKCVYCKCTVQWAMELGSAVSMDIIMTEVRRPKTTQTVEAKKRLTEEEAKEES